MQRELGSRSRSSFRAGPGVRRLLALLLVSVLVTTGSGCQIVIGVLMMLQGKPKLTSDFKSYTRQDLAGKGKKVVVLCTSPETAKTEHTAIDLDIVAEVSRRLRANEVEIVDPHKVGTWMDDNGGDVADVDMLDVGKEFDANYIVVIEVKTFSFREQNSRQLFRGNCKANVRVAAIETTKSGNKTSRIIYNKPFSSTYPVHRPVSSDDVSEPVFQKQYIDRVSEELARLFYDHTAGEAF